MSVLAWPGPSLKYPYFFEEVTYWFGRKFFLSSCLLHKLTSGQEESWREKKEGAFSSIRKLISDIKNTLCQHQRTDK